MICLIDQKDFPILVKGNKSVKRPLLLNSGYLESFMAVETKFKDSEVGPK